MSRVNRMGSHDSDESFWLLLYTCDDHDGQAGVKWGLLHEPLIEVHGAVRRGSGSPDPVPTGRIGSRSVLILGSGDHLA